MLIYDNLFQVRQNMDCTITAGDPRIERKRRSKSSDKYCCSMAA
jgi:hypothetical protein